jgi:hypothetical protein
MLPMICKSPIRPQLLKVPIPSYSTTLGIKTLTPGLWGTFKIQSIATCFSFVFVDDISEEKWVKESSVFNSNLRKQLSTEDKHLKKQLIQVTILLAQTQ